MAEVTQILIAIEKGDLHAAAQLLPVVYDELRRLARHRLDQEPPGQTLQATALVHEAYLRLVGPHSGGDGVAWDSRAHFFAAAAEAIRRILIDSARRKQRLKHGGALERVELEEADLAIEPLSDDLLDLNEALDKLAKEKPALAELVKLRYFTGLRLEEAGRMLGISPTTTDRHWAFARAWLYRELAR